jgi:quinol-cytochrome oxidoreductase complex cytochrome b subunit
VPETTDDFLPGVGSSIVCPIRGGFSIGQETLNRAFTAHTLTLQLEILFGLIRRDAFCLVDRVNEYW